MNSLAPPPPPPVPVPASALAVEPRPPLAEGESADVEELEEFVFEPEPDFELGEVGVRETRDVADRKAADPPPVWTPLVEEMVGAAEASWEPLEDELEEREELDELPLLPLELD
jgi:hypothetical protein